MSRTTLLVLILVLSLLGLLDSWYLAQAAITGEQLACTLGTLDGCNVVARSPYSLLFGIPLGFYGVGFYGAVFLVAATLLSVKQRVLLKLLYAIGIVGILASLAFLYIQFILIKAICIYCIASAVIAFLLFALIHALWRKAKAPVAEPS